MKLDPPALVMLVEELHQACNVGEPRGAMWALGQPLEAALPPARPAQAHGEAHRRAAPLILHPCRQLTFCQCPSLPATFLPDPKLGY